MKTKYFFLLITATLLLTGSTYAQYHPRLNIKYQVEVYSGGLPVYMTVQLYIPGNPGSITSTGMQLVPAQPVNGGTTIDFTGYAFNYDVYSVRIYNNSGGSNDATVGDTMGSNDDFDYKPSGTTLNYDVTYYPGTYYPVQLPPPALPVFNSSYILLH